MGDSNRSLRIRTDVGNSQNININLTQDYDTFEILSLKIDGNGIYKLHNSNYGVVAGRVLANEGFGVPNAKISIFIEAELNEDTPYDIMQLYPFSSVSDTNYTSKRYNLLPDDSVDECHQVIGSFPNKTYLLDNDVMLEVFDKYYKYTTRTNNSGDYLICGVPTGNQKLHMDLDLSDCGILSQRPRDFVYKGYTIEQFENPNQFKVSNELDSLSQVVSQDQTINVIPFWGNDDNGDTIGITRADINVSFKFEPTCIFMGCIAGDNQSNGISKKCVPTEQMGAMDELVTGEGTIEMIRKTIGGDVEEFQIKGTQLIDGNGVWCYQIPMNLDYVMTDEYGNMVATDDPSKGIPTRAQVRFRISMTETDQSINNYFRCKVLVPHNPQNKDEIDYNFGTNTKDISFRDLFWNNVYTVKSYIPRFQKSQRWRSERFSGIKHCNIYGQNNPIPYNSLRIRLPFMFIILCALIKGLIKIITFINWVQSYIIKKIADIALRKKEKDIADKGVCTFIGDGMCPDLDGWYFAPGCGRKLDGYPNGESYKRILRNTLNHAISKDGGSGYERTTYTDETSIDNENGSSENTACLTTDIDYFVSCIEMNLAQEYKVIQFDFYNDWINGFIYMPRWMKQVTRKRSYLFGLIKIKSKHRACYNDSSRFGTARRYTQQCTLEYGKDADGAYNIIKTKFGCDNKKQHCHKEKGTRYFSIFGENGGIVNETLTMKGQYVYYFKPCEWGVSNNQKVNLFANDLVLLGSLNNCDEKGVPQAFKYLSNSSYKMPTNLALTNMDDSGYLYANQNGTVCSNTSSNINDLTLVSGITALYSSFTVTKNYGTTEETKVNYLPMEDVVPVTEAAGISWNYTGPGQGRNDKSNGYYPGGHFLGLSCTNSETNIKTCVNLQRICELGVNISQRREYIRKVINYGNNVEYSVAYHIPSGFISKDEIIDYDFRRMFATMNNKRLIANGVDEKTGYPIYDFIYYNPINFNGSFNEYVIRSSTVNGGLRSYNMKTKDIENGAINDLVGLDIALPKDYDGNEIWYTSTRTIEDGSLDYYLFRLGLTHENYKSKQNEKFLIKGTTASLPQYENSYYFYFGLKEGATALDEFMRQFFSKCEDNRRKMEEPEIIPSVTTDLCTMKGNINVSIFNMTEPYDYVISKGDNIIEQRYGLSVDAIQSKDLEFGTYIVSVTDSNDKTLSETINLGVNLISFNAEYEPFIFKATNFEPEDVLSSGVTYDSGYILVDRYIDIDGIKYDVLPDIEIERRVILYIKGGDNHVLGPSNTPVNSDWKNKKPIILNNKELDCKYKVIPGENPDHTEDKIKIYVWKPNTIYNIHVGYKCDENDSPNYSEIKQIEVKGKYEVDIYMGNPELSYNTIFEEFNGEWWTDTNNIIYKYGKNDNLTSWLMRHYTFRQTLDNNETFDSNVYGVSLESNSITEVLFGQPERQSDIDKLKEMMVDIFPELYNGYSLDDRNSIIPTYGPSNITYNRKYFGKTVVDNDGSVLGYPMTEIKLTNITYSIITNQYTITYEGKNPKLIVGHGCVVQFSDGTLLYPIVDNETTMHANSLSDDIRYDNTMLSSVFVYPVFIYPVIYKPFYNEAHFLETGLKKLAITVDNESVKTPQYYYDSNNFSAAGRIHNGITYNSLFGESYINDINVILSGSSSDMINNNNWGDRITEYGGYIADDSPLFSLEYDSDTYSYVITEGAPSNLTISTPLMQIEGEIVKPKFYDFMSFDYNDRDRTYSFMGYPLGGSDNDVKYYSVNLNGHQPFASTKKMLAIKDDATDTYYLACEYNSNAKYDIVGDDIFVTVIFTLNDETNKYDYEVNYIIKDEDGKVLSEKITGISNTDDIVDCEENIKNELKKVGLDILYASEINKGDYDANAYYDLIKNGTEVIINESKRYDINTFNHVNYTVIGVKEEVMEDGKNVLRIMRLYPDMVDAANYSNGGTKPYLRIIVNNVEYSAPTSNVEIRVKSSGGSTQIPLNSYADWEVFGYNNLPEWFNIPYTFGEAGDQYFSFTTFTNNTSEEREFSFGIKSRSLSISNIVVVQEAPSLELIGSDNIDIPYTGKTITVSFKCTADWKIDYPSWCTLKNGETSEGEGSTNRIDRHFIISENPSNTDDRTGDIKIYLTFNESKYVTVTLNQVKSSKLFINPTAMTLETNETIKTLTVTSDASWTITEDNGSNNNKYLIFSATGGTGNTVDGEQITIGRDYKEFKDYTATALVKSKDKTIELKVLLDSMVHYIKLTDDSSDTYNVDMKGGTIQFTFEASDYWSSEVIKGNSSSSVWCYVQGGSSNSGGAGKSSLTYKIDANDNEETREAVIKVYLLGATNKYFEVTVTQGTLNWGLSINPKSIDLKKGESKPLTVISNVAWTAYADDNWCTLEPTTGGTDGTDSEINIMVTNVNAENKTTYVRVKPDNYGNGSYSSCKINAVLKGELTLNKFGYYSNNDIINDDNLVTIDGYSYIFDDAKQHYLYINFTSNVSWKLEYSDDNMFDKPYNDNNSGGAEINKVLKIRVTENTIQESRTGTITLYLPDYEDEKYVFTIGQAGAVEVEDVFNFTGYDSSIRERIMMLEYGGDVFTVGVDYNGAFKQSSKPDWLDVKGTTSFDRPTNGVVTSTTFTYTAETNTTLSEREGSIRYVMNENKELIVNIKQDANAIGVEIDLSNSEVIFNKTLNKEAINGWYSHNGAYYYNYLNIKFSSEDSRYSSVDECNATAQLIVCATTTSHGVYELKGEWSGMEINGNPTVIIPRYKDGSNNREMVIKIEFTGEHNEFTDIAPWETIVDLSDVPDTTSTITHEIDDRFEIQ